MAANLTSVGISSGVPNSGTGNASTLDGAAGWLQGTANSGATLTWQKLNNGGELTSLASGNAIVLATTISNSSGLDRYMDISLALGSAAFGTGSNPQATFYAYYLNQDGSSYGDGKFGSAAAGPSNYAPICSIPLVAATQAQTGFAVGLPLYPGDLRLVFYNLGTVALSATAASNLVYVRTYR